MTKMKNIAIVPFDQHSTPVSPGWLRLVIISDTHNVEIPEDLFPEGDLLIHAGDHTKNGLFSELTEAATWLYSLKNRFTHGVLAIAGNHDRPLDVETWLEAAPLLQPEEQWNDTLITTAINLFERSDINADSSPMRLLQHSAEKIAGLQFFGSPYIGLAPRRQRMGQEDPRRYVGFSRDHHSLMQLYADIPSGLDVLITHSPPLEILDSSVQYGGIGSEALRNRLWEMLPSERPRLHIFGHEHDSRGIFWHEKLGILFINAAAVNGDKSVIQQGGDYVIKENFHPWIIDIMVSAQ